MTELEDILKGLDEADHRPYDEVSYTHRHIVGGAFKEAIEDIEDATLAEKIYSKGLLERLLRELSASIERHAEQERSCSNHTPR